MWPVPALPSLLFALGALLAHRSAAPTAALVVGVAVRVANGARGWAASLRGGAPAGAQTA